MRQLARHLSSADREIREASVAADYQLRHHRAPAGPYCPDVEFDAQDDFPMCWASSCGPVSIISASRPRFSMAAEQHGHRLAGAQLLFRHGGPGRLPQGPLLSVPEPVDQGPHGPRAAALELGGARGQAIPVMVYTNADEVELFLNGKSLGRKKRFARAHRNSGRSATSARPTSSSPSTAWSGRCLMRRGR